MLLINLKETYLQRRDSLVDINWRCFTILDHIGIVNGHRLVISSIHNWNMKELLAFGNVSMQILVRVDLSNLFEAFQRTVHL